MKGPFVHVHRTHMLVGAIGLLVVACSAVAIASLDSRLFASYSPSAVANASGALSLVTPDYQIQAGPGTFSAGDRLTITGSAAPSSLGEGQLVGAPIKIVASSEPKRPVTFTTTKPHKADPGLIMAALWDSTQNRWQPLYVEQLSDDRLKTFVAHFGSFVELLFKSQFEQQQWQLQAIKAGLKDLLDFPYDCPTADLLQSDLLESAPVGTSSHYGGAIMEVGIKDVTSQSKTVRFYLCNLRVYAMTYVVKGATSLQNSPRSPGPSFPRTTLPLDGVVDGYAGDTVTIEGDFTSDAFAWTAAGAILDVLPWGSALLRDHGKELQQVVSADNVEAMRTAATSCTSSIDAAQVRGFAAGRADGPVKGAIGCLLDASTTFGTVLQDVYGKLLVREGFKFATKAFPVIDLGLAAETFLIEVGFIPPRHVSFIYQLKGGNHGFPDRPKGYEVPPPPLPAPVPAPQPPSVNDPGAGNPGAGNPGTGNPGAGNPGAGNSSQTASFPGPGWWGNAGGPQVIYNNLNQQGLVISWDKSYVYDLAAPGVPLHWYIDVVYKNVGQQTLGVSCNGGQGAITETMQGTANSGVVAAQSTQCTRTQTSRRSCSPVLHSTVGRFFTMFL